MTAAPGRNHPGRSGRAERNQWIGGLERLTVFGDQETLTVEMLPRSGMLWTHNGRRTVQPMFVARSRTSAAPQHARMAANFVKPVEGADG